MSGLKAIRRRITSVQNTKQITRAMKLVSAAKLRRAQDAALNGRAFAERLGGVLERVSADLPEGFSHPLFEKREVNKRRIIVVSGERGLCVAYNTNVIKAVNARDAGSGTNLDFVPIGRRSVASAKRLGWEVVEAFEGLSEEAALWPTDRLGDELIRDFISGDCDQVLLYYTKFISAMNQTVEREVLLPFGSDDARGSNSAGGEGEGDEKAAGAKCEPSAEEIVAELIPLVIKTKLCQAMLEAKASEHASRMTAMDSATRNADDLTDRLRLFYNRARQRTITTELIDIVGGAEAQK